MYADADADDMARSRYSSALAQLGVQIASDLRFVRDAEMVRAYRSVDCPCCRRRRRCSAHTADPTCVFCECSPAL
jgi:hypothetical protein